MKYQKTNDGYVIVLQKGEKLIESLTGFCRRQQVRAGFLTGLGGVLSAGIGYYHLDGKEYEFKELNEVLEIASLHGNVALKADEPFLHVHVVLSDPELKTYGGHLKEAVVGGTCEIHLNVFEGSMRREHDEETGLDLIDL